jgi:plasmid replication initiation protein
MQKLYKSKTPKVYKNKKLNNANFGTYNLNDYQVFLQLVSKLGKVDINGTYKQSEQLDREHTITAKEFSQAFGVDLNTSYGILKRAGNRLARTAITLQKPELFQIWDIAICAIAKYNTKEGSLTIKFTEEIMPYLAQVQKKYILYNLKEVANFGSLYTTRLYELIQEFKDTGWIEKSVNQLREVFAVGKKFPDYNNFKRKTFAHAIDEINSQYDMNLKFEERKEGRKVVLIRFEFTPSYNEQGYNPATKQMVNVTVKPKRKPKQNDDETPPPVHPKQQELQNIKPENDSQQKQSLLASVADKTLKALTTPEVYQAIKDDTSIADGAKKARTRRAETIKQTIEEIEEIIEAVMEEYNLTRTRAKVKAMKLGLLVIS